MKRREMGEARQWENRYKGDFIEKHVKLAITSSIMETNI